MELRDFALRVLTASRLTDKLAPAPPGTTDDEPGPALVVPAPGRPPSLAIRPGREAKVPGIKGMADPAQKVRILHAFANHELQAIELFALAILRFPDAPGAFRRGLLAILGEEQSHCRLYVARLAALGVGFGDLPVSGYFWGKVRELTTPARFVAAMALTFESANLDHAIEYARAARARGDPETARILERVHDEEIGHVRFGWTWLAKWKPPERSMLEEYRRNLVAPLRLSRARGPVLHPESRRAAGMDEAFIAALAGEGPGERKNNPRRAIPRKPRPICRVRDLRSGSVPDRRPP